mgnify:CR=1 FL=1
MEKIETKVVKPEISFIENDITHLILTSEEESKLDGKMKEIKGNTFTMSIPSDSMKNYQQGIESKSIGYSSLNTKPSRSLSQGRLAASGSSLRVDSARAAAKPPKPTGVVAISAPPTTITSASPI